jgi:large subunit ribosomal protein L22e
MVKVVRRGGSGPKKAKKTLTFHIDCSRPVEDSIMEIAAFEKFLTDKIKVEGKTGTCDS